jgi:hypothetical protein
MLLMKDTPLLFLTLSVKLLHKLIGMDHKRALPTLTQLDYWTYLVDLLHMDRLAELEGEENRLIIKVLKGSLLRPDEEGSIDDKILMIVNAVIEIIFEGFKRDAQLANMLVRTTKMMNNVFDILTQIINRYNSNELRLQSRNLIVIFFDKVVKLLHLALMHPKDYSVEVISRFLNSDRRPS